MEEEAQRGSGLDSRFPKLIFMGTPDFAVPSLQRLVDAGAPVVLAITQPDRRSGRGKKLTPPPVKILAEKLNIPVLQPERIREEEVVERILSFDAECATVVAYGQILPQSLLDALPLGALNVHASLLPRYRGAAPIQRALLAGDEETGVSIMLLDAGMDTGPVLAMKSIHIRSDDNNQTLRDRLSLLGGDLLCETIIEWRAGLAHPRAQDDSLATFAPPIRKEELRLSWELPADRIINAIRAFDPSPGAYGFFAGKRIKCFNSSLLHWNGEGGAGEVVGFTDKGLVVLGGDGRAFVVGELQMEGQRRLSAAEFLRGHPIPPGSRLE